jgi:hypothetical protein
MPFRHMHHEGGIILLIVVAIIAAAVLVPSRYSYRDSPAATILAVVFAIVLAFYLLRRI